MNISFYKYQGTGNDFVMIDDRDEVLDLSDISWVKRLCDRKFGIGADGLIAIRNHKDYDFEMVYFNSDGSQSMCGNGARCAVAFAGQLGIVSEKTKFLAIDGPHEALLSDSIVELKMGDVSSIDVLEGDFFLNTGSPHHIRMVEEIDSYPVFEQGKEVRYSEQYQPAGTNVNFIQKQSEERIFVRTYERGVENETLSCGTGVTAAALAFAADREAATIQIQTLGGELAVRFEKAPGDGYQNIWLIGPAERVFSGEIKL